MKELITLCTLAHMMIMKNLLHPEQVFGRGAGEVLLTQKHFPRIYFLNYNA